MLSFLSAEDDFAEIISATLTSKPKELADAALTAQTPDTDIDPEVSQRYAKEAEQAYKEFMAKQAFVNEYVQKVFGRSTSSKCRISVSADYTLT